jgi:hypothetical protein
LSSSIDPSGVTEERVRRQHTAVSRNFRSAIDPCSDADVRFCAHAYTHDIPDAATDSHPRPDSDPGPNAGSDRHAAPSTHGYADSSADRHPDTGANVADRDTAWKLIITGRPLSKGGDADGQSAFRPVPSGIIPPWPTCPVPM